MKEKEILENHPYFKAWCDPQSKVTSYILMAPVGKFKKVLYYTSASIPASGDCLWFFVTDPPDKGWRLARINLDPEKPDFIVFNHVHSTASPYIYPDGKSALVTIDKYLCRVWLDGTTDILAGMPEEVLNRRFLFRMATDLTVSADSRHVVLDSHIGNRYLISIFDINSRNIKPVRWFAENHHHAMFSTFYPDVFIVNRGPWYDPFTGDKFDMNNRIWLMNMDMNLYEPLFSDLLFGINCFSCHEWWQSDGTVAWVDYEEGVYETGNIFDNPRKRRVVWHHRWLCHAKCDYSKKYYCADESPYYWNDKRPCRVWFYDVQAQREIPIVSSMDQPPIEWGERRAYHIDPHPNFSSDGKYIVFTISAYGQLTVALTPVSGILKTLYG